MACKKRQFCANEVMKNAYLLGIELKQAMKVNGILYRFVLIEKDGSMKGYHYGNILQKELRERLKEKT